jgi:DNA polymerase I-like protein with 3'-5' exonuclease and polymerase domains/5'-3' exonuclease
VKHILDLRGIVLHSYHTTPYLETFKDEEGKQQPTTAHGVQTFLERYLLPILDKAQPIDVIAVGEGGSDRRRALYVDYKSKASSYSERVSNERDACVTAVEKILVGIGATLIKYPKVEADDTIALLCQKLSGPKTVWTGDRDLTQLQGPGVIVKFRGVTESAFEGYSFEEFGSNVVTLYKSIVGDSSDGYGGVSGLGAAFFEKLTKEGGPDLVTKLCGVADARDHKVLAALAHDSALVTKLKAKSDEWFTSWQLAKLHPEWCEMSFREKLCRPIIGKRLPNLARVEAALSPLGLSELTNMFTAYHYSPILADKKTLEGRVEKLIEALQNSPMVAYDYETYDTLKCDSFQKARKGFVDVYSQEVVGVSFAYGSNFSKCVYIPIRHENTDNVPMEWVKQILEGLQGYEKVAHNTAFESYISKKCFGLDFYQETYDTMHLFSHYDENLDRGLKSLSKAFLNYDQIAYSQIVGKDKDMRNISGDEVLRYGADDAICTLQLYFISEMLCQLEDTDVFAKTVEPFFEAAMAPRYVKGTKIDRHRLKVLTEEASKAQTEKEAELRSLLAENCSEIVETGALLIFEDFEPYWTETLVQKGKSEQEIIDFLEAKRADLIQKSKYAEWKSPELDWVGKKALRNLTKIIGLPALRGSKIAWVSMYVEGLYEQAAERCADPSDAFTDEQRTLLKALKDCPELLEVNLSNRTIAKALATQTDYKEKSKSLLDLFKLSLETHQSDESFWEGDELNIDSPKQMTELLYVKLCLPILLRNIDKSDSNNKSEWDLEQSPSTGINAVETWLVYETLPEWKKRVLELVLELRAISTKFKLYFNPYPLLFHPEESTEEFGVLRPSLKNCGTVTRRPSSSTPNVLQVSKKGEGEIRSMFLPDSPDHVVVSIDFKQQELVILGCLSGDETLLSCYTGPVELRSDVHGLTGTSILNIQNQREGKSKLSYKEFMERVKGRDKVCVAIRKKPAKMTNFLTVYGGSSMGLARKAVVTPKEAESFISAFFLTYPRVADYQDAQEKRARRFGYTKTMYGSRKHCDGIFDKNKAIASSWGRQGVNAPIQGTAADVLKMVLKEAVTKKLQERLGACFIAPVYDEIVASVPKQSVVQFIEEMVNIMEVTLPGTNVTLGTSVSIGNNWGDQVELEEQMLPEESRPTPELIRKVLQDLENA